MIGLCALFRPERAREGNEKQGSNTFALQFCSNEIIDVDIILPFTLSAS